MTTNPLNVLILTIDALRADRTSLLGYNRPTTPTLERLAKNALVCEKAFSLGPFTQSACIQLFTSSRPLSYGGYDHGARDRPETLFKKLNDEGYRTTNLSTLHWVNKYFGYGPGVDEEVPLFSLNSFPGVLLAMVRNTLIAFDQETVDEKAMLQEVEPMVLKFFADVVDYCHWQIDHAISMKADFPDSAIVNSGYDYRRILNLLSKHEKKFKDSPADYVNKHLVPAATAADWVKYWLPAEWYYMRRSGRLVGEALHRLVNKAISPFNPKLAKARNSRFKQYVDASSLADKTISVLEKHDSNQPFCVWAHFMDTHVPYVSGPGRNWYSHTPEYLKSLGYNDDYSPALTFDAKPKRPEDGFSSVGR
ncbi:MAG: sulfatase-like hydrolase/transferase [Rhodospirillales bacterium]|nr:sulfatase-like hydrolase/transferase [Rhodospirillales bacterium]